MNQKRFVPLIIISVLLLLLSGCSSAGGRTRVSVVASNFAVYDFARAVSGDECDVTMLLPPGGDSHNYELTMSDISKIASADLFIYVGGESEDWAEDAIGSIGSDMKGKAVRAVDCVSLLDEATVPGMQTEDDESGEPETDEHVWLSSSNAQKIIAAISAELSEILPEKADVFSANAEKYSAEFVNLGTEYAEMMKSSVRNTIVVADRFPFRYLAEECGFDYFAAFSGCSSATEPTLATVNFLIDKVKEGKIPYIYVIEFSDCKTADAVTAETGAGILTLQSGHSVTKEQFDSGVTFAELMRDNLEALKKGLCG